MNYIFYFKITYEFTFGDPDIHRTSFKEEFIAKSLKDALDMCIIEIFNKLEEQPYYRLKSIKTQGYKRIDFI